MKTLLITGAAQGIALATARLFADRGWRVLGLDRHRFEADGIEAVLCDLADATQIETAVSAIGKVDCLINNAASAANGDPRLLSVADWNRVLAVNLTAPFLLSRLLADGLTSIINIASTRALMSEAHTEAYSASKGGLLSLTHALAMSLAPVRVNAISPGWIEHAHPESLRGLDHAFHPAGRVGRCEDVAETAWFLASGAAAFITGQNFVVDGGVTKKMIYPE